MQARLPRGDRPHICPQPWARKRLTDKVSLARPPAALQLASSPLPTLPHPGLSEPANDRGGDRDLEGRREWNRDKRRTKRRKTERERRGIGKEIRREMGEREV